MIWNPFPWILGLLGCQIMSMFTEIVVYVSIFTMIAFTFERYVHACILGFGSLNLTISMVDAFST